jgi:hypothetical protein
VTALFFSAQEILNRAFDATNNRLKATVDEVATLSVTDTTDATSTTSAPLKSAGGLAVAKSAYIGETLNATASKVGTANANQVVSVARATTGIVDNTATSILTLTIVNPADSTSFNSASLVLNFSFLTRTDAGNYMVSSVLLTFNVSRIRNLDAAVSAIAFLSAVTSGELNTTATHTALATGQFALTKASGTSADTQVWNLMFTNDYDPGVVTAVAQLSGNAYLSHRTAASQAITIS